MKTLSFYWSDTLNTLYIYVTKFTMENSLLKKVCNIWKKIHLRTCIVYVGASFDTMTILYKTLVVEFFLSFEIWSVWKIKAGNYNYTLLNYFSGVKVVLVHAFLGFNALTTAHFGVNFTASRQHCIFHSVYYSIIEIHFLRKSLWEKVNLYLEIPFIWQRQSKRWNKTLYEL